MNDGALREPSCGDESRLGLVGWVASSTSMTEWVAPTDALRFRFELLG